MTPKKQRKNIFEPVDKPIGEIPRPTIQEREWAPENQIVEAEKVEKKEMPKTRNWLYSLIVVSICAIFVFKLMNLQIAQGQENRLLAEDNRIRSSLIEAPRGEIIDSSDEILVSNTANYVMQIYPYNLPKQEDEYNALVDSVKTAVGYEGDLSQKIKEEKERSFDPVIIKEDIEKNEATKLRIKFAEYSGVEITALPKREYRKDMGLAHILGYVGKMSKEDVNDYPDYPTSGQIGKTGIESSYDAYLRGVSGENQVEIDSSGQIKRVLKTVPAQIGSTVKLNLVSELQKVLYDELKSAIEKSGGKSGSAIALDPQTGGIYSMVSLPDYDLNIFSGRTDKGEYSKLIEDPNLPLLNRAIGGLFPPGSSIKPFVAAAGLDAGVIDEDTSIITPSEIKIGEWVFPDWKPHGSADVKTAIAESNNIFFYAVGGGYDKISGLGSDRLKSYLDEFGFSSETGIDISGEQSGLVPNEEWKKEKKNENWYVGDTYHMSIGQGDLLVTPIELATATSAIANGGTLYEPRFVSEILNAETGEVEREIIPSIAKKDFISSESLRIVREGMRQTITDGSGYSTFGDDFPIEVAGKTGTAQFGTEDKTHAWFTSYAPYNDPKLVITVFIEAGGEGYQTAAPVAKAAFKWYADNIESLD